MAVAVRITPKQMTKADYEQMIDELEKAGCGEPDGRTFHAAYGDDEVHVFEVYETKEQWDDHRENMVNCLQASGVDLGTVEVRNIH